LTSVYANRKMKAYGEIGIISNRRKNESEHLFSVRMMMIWHIALPVILILSLPQNPTIKAFKFERQIKD